MPSTYAHYRFGKRVLDRLPEETRRGILQHRALYDIGLQGPDILFHYKAFSANPVNRLGHRMHEWSGRRFFGGLCGKADSGAAQAYLMGLLCHFTLDSVCHGTVNETSARTGVHHFDIETEYERALMEEDGLNPFRHRPTAHYAPNRQLGRVMADFFGIEEAQALAAVRAMKRNIDLLVARNPVWRRFVETVLRAAKADSFYRLMVKKDKNAQLAECTRRLKALGLQAEDVALRLMEALDQGILLQDEQLRLDFSGIAAEEEA